MIEESVLELCHLLENQQQKSDGVAVSDGEPRSVTSTTTTKKAIKTVSYDVLYYLSDHPKPSSASVWGYGILCVTVISAMSVMGVGVLPFMSKQFYSSLLTALIGLAVGSLTGSAIFHLIPSAFLLSDVAFFPHHSYLSVSLVIFGGIYGFFIIERLLKMFMEVKSKKQSELAIH